MLCCPSKKPVRPSAPTVECPVPQESSSISLSLHPALLCLTPVQTEYTHTVFPSETHASHPTHPIRPQVHSSSPSPSLPPVSTQPTIQICLQTWNGNNNT